MDCSLYTKTKTSYRHYEIVTLVLQERRESVGLNTEIPRAGSTLRQSQNTVTQLSLIPYFHWMTRIRNFPIRMRTGFSSDRGPYVTLNQTCNTLTQLGYWLLCSACYKQEHKIRYKNVLRTVCGKTAVHSMDAFSPLCDKQREHCDLVDRCEQSCITFKIPRVRLSVQNWLFLTHVYTSDQVFSSPFWKPKFLYRVHKKLPWSLS